MTGGVALNGSLGPRPLLGSLPSPARGEWLCSSLLAEHPTSPDTQVGKPVCHALHLWAKIFLSSFKMIISNTLFNKVESWLTHAGDF